MREQSRMRQVSVLDQLTWRKPILRDAHLNDHEGGLKKCLNKFDLVAYGVGNSVGAGVFVTTGTICAFSAGPSVCVSFLLAGFAALLSGLSYAELAGRLPIAGGAYTYAYSTMGELLGWFIGWNMTFQFAFAAGSIAVSWANYITALFKGFGIIFPQWTQAQDWGSPVFQFYPLALVIVVLCTLLLLLGANESAKFNVAVTVWNVGLISLIIVLGLIHVDADNWTPFMPYGFQGTLAGAGLAMFSYIGFDSVSTLSAETRNPQSDIPFGLIGSLSIACALYSLTSLVVSGLVPYGTLQLKDYVNAPLSEAFAHIGMGWASKLIAFGSVTTLTCTVLCSLMGQPRLLFPMAHDGLLPKCLYKVNKRGVPVLSTLMTFAFAGVLAVFFKFSFLADAITVASIIIYTVNNAAVLYMRIVPHHHDLPSSDSEAGKRKRTLPPWVSLVALLWFSVGSWGFWVLFTRLHSDICIVVISGIFFVVIPLIVLMYAFYFTEISPAPETFKCPFMPITPLAAIFVNGCLMSGLSQESYWNVLAWTGLGLLVYFGYGLRHSNAHRHFVAPSPAKYGAIASGDVAVGE